MLVTAHFLVLIGLSLSSASPQSDSFEEFFQSQNGNDGAANPPAGDESANVRPPGFIPYYFPGPGPAPSRRDNVVIVHDCNNDGDKDKREPVPFYFPSLPPGWEIKYDKDGNIVFVFISPPSPAPPPAPTAAPTPAPTAAPTPAPTAAPTPAPTPAPTNPPPSATTPQPIEVRTSPFPAQTTAAPEAPTTQSEKCECTCKPDEPDNSFISQPEGGADPDENRQYIEPLAFAPRFFSGRQYPYGGGGSYYQHHSNRQYYY